MLEFKIDSDSSAATREANRRLVSWGVVLLSFAMTLLIFILGFQGLLSAGSDLHWLGWLLVPASLGAVIGASILAIREALRYAERKMVVVLDDKGIIRRREGYPDVRIDFSEVDTLREELRWLVVKSTEPQRKIAIPDNIKEFEVIRAELAKHHALSAPVKKFPLKNAAPITVSILSWASILWFRDMRVVIPAGIIGMTLLASESRHLWTLSRRGPRRWLPLASLAIAWVSAILLIYIRVLRP
jgi:hypothetical protein